MPNKSFSIYGAEEISSGDDSQLLIEIAGTHLACIVTHNNKTAITDCELFTFNEEEINQPAELFEGIVKQSKLLSLKAASVKCYINNENCLPVPIFKFNKEIAADYLNVVFGERSSTTTYYEHLPVDPGIMNVYRVPNEWIQWLSKRFEQFTIHHTYSNVLRRILTNPRTSLPVITIQFYNTFMIVVLVKDENLQLIQSFTYDTADDVLYYLLNIAKQFGLSETSLSIQISGMIDLDFKLYRELITYFKNVTVEVVDDDHLKLDIHAHPMHYFIPFFNLAV